MIESSKNSVLLALDLLHAVLKETDTLIGIEVNKTDYNKSKLAFISHESYCIQNFKDGFTVSLDELNKDIINQ